jgi:hypothetical protein
MTPDRVCGERFYVLCHISLQSFSSEGSPLTTVYALLSTIDASSIVHTPA